MRCLYMQSHVILDNFLDWLLFVYNVQAHTLKACALCSLLGWRAPSIHNLEWTSSMLSSPIFWPLPNDLAITFLYLDHLYPLMTISIMNMSIKSFQDHVSWF